MVGILAQVDDIFSWASHGGKLIGTRWGIRIQGHGFLNILCGCNIRRSARWQREHGFLLDQHYGDESIEWQNAAALFTLIVAPAHK